MENWNWQKNEERKLDEINEEEEYLAHVEAISHPEDYSKGGKGATFNEMQA